MDIDEVLAASKVIGELANALPKPAGSDNEVVAALALTNARKILFGYANRLKDGMAPQAALLASINGVGVTEAQQIAIGLMAAKPD